MPFLNLKINLKNNHEKYNYNITLFKTFHMVMGVKHLSTLFNIINIIITTLNQNNYSPKRKLLRNIIGYYIFGIKETRNNICNY
jgi:hypothetical protein